MYGSYSRTFHSKALPRDSKGIIDQDVLERAQQVARFVAAQPEGVIDSATLKSKFWRSDVDYAVEKRYIYPYQHHGVAYYKSNAV